MCNINYSQYSIDSTIEQGSFVLWYSHTYKNIVNKMWSMFFVKFLCLHPYFIGLPEGEEVGLLNSKSEIVGGLGLFSTAFKNRVGLILKSGWFDSKVGTVWF